ncbi:MAG: hypothetical protein JWO23_727 [Solirubrobacterales bacterium]|jgi:hypothetical protein|nr:hypothetical protein [Solirubrobacterales bacterium]MCW3025150.1 hypothetical protein [Solirubrobacterales bacterium]
MPVDTVLPDLQVSLHLDPFAPRAARYYVAQLDRPSPDLRDAVVLLTSELVSRAVEQCEQSPDESVELLAWMPPDIVRVELRAPRELLDLSAHADRTHYDMLLLDQVADRWSMDTADSEDGEPSACMWFEIDRNVTE